MVSVFFSAVIINNNVSRCFLLFLASLVMKFCTPALDNIPPRAWNDKLHVLLVSVSIFMSARSLGGFQIKSPQIWPLPRPAVVLKVPGLSPPFSNPGCPRIPSLNIKPSLGKDFHSYTFSSLKKNHPQFLPFRKTHVFEIPSPRATCHLVWESLI